MKSRRDHLRCARLREEVTCELLDSELIEGHVVAVGADHPVTPRPHIARPVCVVDRAVAIASRVHPGEGHALGVVFAREQAIDELLISLGPIIAHEGADLLRRRRHTAEIEGEPAHQRRAISLSRGRHPSVSETSRDEGVHFIARPIPLGLSGL